MDTQNGLGAELIERALSGENTKFTQLRFAKDYINTRVMRIALRRIIRLFEQSADKLFNVYCKDVRKHQADVTALLAYKTFLQIIDFYKKDLTIINSELKDYEDWLLDGNFISAFIFGAERELY